MTVNTVDSIAEFVTNGVTTNFPFYFKFLANEDLVVTYIDPLGVSTTLTLGTNYTVNGAGNDQGSVVTTAALAGPGQLTVSREMEAFQQTSLRNQGKFLAETHEDVFDKLTMLIQQGLSTFKRALTRPFGRDYFDAENRLIKSVKDPIEAQDAATKHSVEAYVSSILATGQGSINNAANVIYAPPSGVVRSVASKLQEFVSVKDYGATGAGAINDFDTFIVASNVGKTVYVPPGIYRMSTTGTISADLHFSRDAQLTIDPGKTVTITGKITAPTAKIFTGGGAVVFGVKVGMALPEWFGARDGSNADGAAIRKCIDACRQFKVTTLFGDNDYNAEAGFDGRLYPNSHVMSLPNAQINSTGAVNGFTLEPGNYAGYKYTLPRLAQFPGEAIKLRGASLANVELPSIQAGGDGIVFQAQAADANTLLDSKVVCHVISAMTGNAILVKGDATANVLQGNEVYVNFVTSCLRAVLFFAPSPAVPNWDGFKFVFQAVDPTTAVSGAVGLSAIADGAVPKCVFRVETWFGGFPSNGAFVLGQFNGLDFYANYNESFQNYNAWQLTGVGNRITTAFRGFGVASAALPMTLNANSRAAWNGGAPIQFTDLYLQGTLTAALAAGATIDFFFYHPYAATQKFSSAPVDLNGLMVQKIETTANSNEIRVQVLNVSGAPKASGQVFKLMVNVGT